MAGWHHRYNEYELGQTLGGDEGQGSLRCCMQPLESQRVKHCGRLNKASEVVYGRPLLPSGGPEHKSTSKEFLALKTSTPQSTAKPAVPG